MILDLVPFQIRSTGGWPTISIVFRTCLSWIHCCLNRHTSSLDTKQKILKYCKLTRADVKVWWYIWLSVIYAPRGLWRDVWYIVSIKTLRSSFHAVKLRTNRILQAVTLRALKGEPGCHVYDLKSAKAPGVMAEYAYDEEGFNFYYFLLSVLSLCLVPVTLHSLYGCYAAIRKYQSLSPLCTIDLLLTLQLQGREINRATVTVKHATRNDVSWKKHDRNARLDKSWNQSRHCWQQVHFIVPFIDALDTLGIFLSLPDGLRLLYLHTRCLLPNSQSNTGIRTRSLV